ncbi:acetyl-CoA carboxylase biotin carboxyl carrier protein subunit, partial [Sphingomonas sp.]|uniref:acetyl-CoA carboxylase biotin carboxyl carrier protein subunit n=1 Tax=Sphingomonas sp. TaxID=28214 RepID=UPI0039C92545
MLSPRRRGRARKRLHRGGRSRRRALLPLTHPPREPALHRRLTAAVAKNIPRIIIDPVRIRAMEETVMALVKVRSDLTASVWKVEVAVGQTVAENDVLAILESMKTEIPVEAPVA